MVNSCRDTALRTGGHIKRKTIRSLLVRAQPALEVKWMDDSKTPVALLGSSGIVSQRFQQRLANHPWFRLEVVFGSSKNSGKLITDLQWHLKEEKPDLPKLTVISGEPSDLIFQLEKLNIKYVFSTLPTEEAATFERQLQAAGFTIFPTQPPTEWLMMSR